MPGGRGGVDDPRGAPFVLPRAEGPFPREAGLADTRLGWRLVSPRMTEMYPPISLGETAKNVADRYQAEQAAPGRVRAAQSPAGGRGAGRGPVRR